MNIGEKGEMVMEESLIPTTPTNKPSSINLHPRTNEPSSFIHKPSSKYKPLSKTI